MEISNIKIKFRNLKILNFTLSRLRRGYSIVSVSFFILIFTFLISASPEANAGTIIKAPAYLGLQNGLVGCWNFDGAYTKAQDCTSNNNDGTLTGGPTKTNGKVGQALNLDGVNDGVDLPDPTILNFSGTNAFTISAWVYPRGGDTSGTIFSRGSHGAAADTHVYSLTRYEFIANSWTVKVSNGTTSETCIVTQTNTLLLNVWQYVTFTFNGATDTCSFYRNGIFIESDTSAVNLWDGDAAGDRNTGIGYDKFNTRDYWNGLIDEVRIYNRALSAGEIARLYRIGLGSNVNRSTVNSSLTNGLVGCWSFDGLGTKVQDCSGNNRVGTKNGGTSLKPVAGKVGQALSFDGSNDYVSIDNESPFDFTRTQPFSLVAWINIDNRGVRDNEVVTKYEPDFDGYGFYVATDGSVTFALQGVNNGGSGFIAVKTTSTTVAPVGQWTQVIATYDGSSDEAGLDIFINGGDVATTITGSVNLSGATAILNDENLLIGDDVEADGCCNFGGKIDEVRIYNRALSAGEIARLYNSTQSKFNSSNTDTLKNGLVGCWNFDGLYTKAPDCSGNNNTGTLNSGPTKVSGKIGQALRFDGSNDNVNAGTGTSLDDVQSQGGGGMTISFWAKVDSNAFGVLLSKGTSNAGWQVQKISSSDPARLNFQHEGTTDLGVSWNNIFDTGKWVHTVITWDGGVSASGVRAYKNGSFIAQTASSDGNTLDSDATHVFCMGGGGSASCSTSASDASLDEVRIYNRALSAGEINKLYQMGR